MVFKASDTASIIVSPALCTGSKPGMMLFPKIATGAAASNTSFTILVAPMTTLPINSPGAFKILSRVNS